MEENRLAGVLHSVAKRMRADFDQSRGLRHRGEAGSSREILVRDLIASRVPAHVKVLRSGEIITASGETSPQCDILVVDRSTPPFTDMQGYRIVPNECVYGVVEVKSTLNREQLIDACTKIRKVKKLPKTAYHPHPGFDWVHEAYGKTYPHPTTAGIIFAFDSIDLGTLGNHLAEWCADVELDERPDSVWVLGKGYLVWADGSTNSIKPWADPGSQLWALEPLDGEDVLLPLTLQIADHFATAKMPPFRLHDYAADAIVGVHRHTWPVPHDH